jgi:hypothetical protein
MSEPHSLTDDEPIQGRASAPRLRCTPPYHCAAQTAHVAVLVLLAGGAEPSSRLVWCGVVRSSGDHGVMALDWTWEAWSSKRYQEYRLDH